MASNKLLDKDFTGKSDFRNSLPKLPTDKFTGNPDNKPVVVSEIPGTLLNKVVKQVKRAGSSAYDTVKDHPVISGVGAASAGLLGAGLMAKRAMANRSK